MGEIYFRVGTRLTIYEAMTTELLLVSTRIRAESLSVKGGEEILLRGTSHEFAQAIVKLLKNESLTQKISEEQAKAVSEKLTGKNLPMNLPMNLPNFVR